MGVAVGMPCPVCDDDTHKILRYDSIDRRPWGMLLKCRTCSYEWYYAYFSEIATGPEIQQGDSSRGSDDPGVGG